MLPCHGCAYRRSIPGNFHISCAFDWSNAKREDVPRNDNQRVAHWFLFPFNYDPTWGPDTCAGRSDTADDSKIAKPNPLAELLSLLG